MAGQTLAITANLNLSSEMDGKSISAKRAWVWCGGGVHTYMCTELCVYGQIDIVTPSVQFT